ncbi:MAG: glycerophosphodiester phosphodiesterase [Candidatus Granulicatella sp. P6S_S16_bin.50.1]|nr:glycerophosphodiester phosphodiesterase [Candidatus Granulicatella sp. P6S_S16_bin.50.1]
MTKIFAHRGSKGTHPENTLASFKEAVRVGSDGIELDVHLTKDGQLVVIHDETVDRTTNGTGEIRTLTLAEIKELDAGSWFHNKYAGEKIPTLEEVLLLLTELGFNGQLNIELKTDVIQYKGLVEKCLALQSAKDWPFAIVYSSFNPYTLVELKEANPSQEIGLLFESKEWADKGDAMLEKESYHPDLKLLDWAIEWNRNQLPLRVWTVNEDTDINRCFELLIEAIFTDYPEKALQLKENYER